MLDWVIELSKHDKSCTLSKSFGVRLLSRSRGWKLHPSICSWQLLQAVRNVISLNMPWNTVSASFFVHDSFNAGVAGFQILWLCTSCTVAELCVPHFSVCWQLYKMSGASYAYIHRRQNIRFSCGAVLSLFLYSYHRVLLVVLVD